VIRSEHRPSEHGWDPGRHGEIPEGPNEVIELVVGIDPARVRQHPHRAASDPLVAGADPRVRPPEGGPVRGHADDGNERWAPPEHLRGQALRSLTQGFCRELVGGPRGPGNQIGDTETVAEQQRVFEGLEATIGELSEMERWPEAIAWTSEVIGRRRLSTNSG
jgi:hypothetical protein